MHHGVCSVYDRATARTVEQEMMPYGLNGQWHYADCTVTLNSDPECHCLDNMVKQLSILSEECKRLMQINRQLKKQLDRATHD